jgi:purine-binding chemotaxis protein CheW
MREVDERTLLCRVRSCLCALPLRHVIETMRPLPIRPLEGAAPGVLGLCKVRGGPAPVLDAGALLGTAGPAAHTRFVTLRVERRLVALAVEAVVGVASFPGGAFRELPPLLQASAAEAVCTIRAADSELALLLDAARLVPEALCPTTPGTPR